MNCVPKRYAAVLTPTPIQINVNLFANMILADVTKS